MTPRAMTLVSLFAVSACASAGNTVDISSRDVSPTTVATTTVSPSRTLVGSLSRESIVAVQACLGALVDDPRSPGANFVETLRKLSVGYTLVEPLAAAQTLCTEAARQLDADPHEPGSSAADLLAATNDVNTALDLAADQIRTDAFYQGGTMPKQFIPDGAAALQNSVAAFYSRASFTLGM